MSLPLFVYALSRMSKSDRVRKEQAAQQERENTLYSFGHQVDDTGNPVGSFRQMGAEDNAKNFKVTHLRMGSGDIFAAPKLEKDQTFTKMYSSLDGKTIVPELEYTALPENDKKNYTFMGVRNDLTQAISESPSYDYAMQTTNVQEVSEDAVKHVAEDGEEFDSFKEADEYSADNNLDRNLITRQIVTTKKMGDNVLSTSVNVSDISLAAENARNAAIDENRTVRSKDGTILFASKATTDSGYDTDFISWASKNKGNKDLWESLDDGTMNQVRSTAYNYIVRNEGIMVDGRYVTDPNKLISVSHLKYPNLFAIPGFRREFDSRVLQIPRDQLQYGDEQNGVSPEESMSFTATAPLDDTKVAVNLLPPGNLNVKQAHTALLEWGTKNKYADDVMAARLGNVLVTSPVPGNPTAPLRVEAEQPYLMQMLDLAQRPSLSGTGTVLDMAHRYYNPAIRNKKPNNDELKQVGNVLVGEKDYNKKLSIVGVFSPDLNRIGSNSVFAEYNTSKFAQEKFEGKEFSDMQIQSAGEAKAGMESVRLIEQSMSLLIGNDGNFVRYGQRVGETLLSVSGFIATSKNLVADGLSAVGISADSPVVGKLFGDLEAVSKALETGDATAAQQAFTEFNDYAKATSSATAGPQDAEVFKKKEAEARESNVAYLRQTITDMASGDNKLANVARRKYLNYIIAYSVAAALQGGTGGRTISDQDVQNVLNFLQPSNFATAQQEYHNLSSLRDDLMYRSQRAAAFASPIKQTVMDAMIVEDLSQRSSVRDLDTMLQQRFGDGVKYDQPAGRNGGGPGPSPTGAAFGETTIPDNLQDQFLAYVNTQLTLVAGEGETPVSYSSFEDLQKDSEKLESAAALFMRRR